MAKKKMTKKKALKTTPEKERHFGVILENIDSNIHLVIERQDILDRKIDVLDKKVDGLAIRTAKLGDLVDVLDIKFDRLNSDFSNFKTETRSNFKII